MEARRASVREKKKPDYFGATSSNALTDRPHKATSVDNLTTQESGTASLLTERTREEYNRSFVMGGIERSPPQKKTMEVNPKDNANSLEIPPYSNSTVNPNANETSERQGAPFQTQPSQPLAPMLHGMDTNNVNGVVTPMDTAPAPVVQPPVVLPATRNVESEEARNARMRIERERKVQELKDNRQRFIIHGTDDESEVDHHDDTGGAVDNSIITGKMLNLMDLQQKHQYANAFHINRIESNQNQFILRITGHDIQDTSDLTTVHSWWEWLMIELGAPSNIRHLDSSLIHFSTNVIENKGRNEGPQGTRKVLILEFPNKEVPKWVLNHGVMNCRKVQRIRGLERLSFSPMLTTADLKVQQYAQGVFNRLKMNFNGPPATRKPFLANIASIRPIGRIKQHISTVDNAGFKKNIHYNKFITDELTREFLPLEGGEIALPPPQTTLTNQMITHY